MNAAVKRLLTVLVSLLLLSYVGYQAYNVLYNPVRTVRAGSGTFEDIIKTDAFILHKETVVVSDHGSGVIDYVRQNGESVAKGGQVAAIYRAEQDAANQRKIQALRQLIDQYKQTGNSANAQSIDIDVLSSEIEKSFLELSEATNGSSPQTIADKKADMLTLLNKKQLVTGEIRDFNAEIASLQKQCDALSAGTGAQTGSISAPVAGFFVSSSDGFENIYNIKNVLSITATETGKLLNAKPNVGGNAIGRIIEGHESYIVCNLSADDAYKLHIGSTVQLRFVLSSQPQLPVTVAAINKSAAGVSVVLKCTTMTSTLASLRKQSAEIIANNYTGIKVADTFLHVVGGNKGVFVRNGNIAQFKKINPIYSAAGFTVSSIDETKGDTLQIYDEVIENGDDLYDGKVIK